MLSGKIMVAGAFFLLIFLSATLNITATSLFLLSTEELTEKSDVILTGRVISQHCQWNDERNQIYTYISIRADTLLKNGKQVENDIIVIKQLGGIMDSLQLFIPGMPSFDVGEEVLLFLTDRETDPVSGRPLNYLVYGLAQGKFSVIFDPVSGQRILRNALSSLLFETEEKIPKATAGKAQSLDEFVEEITVNLKK